MLRWFGYKHIRRAKFTKHSKRISDIQAHLAEHGWKTKPPKFKSWADAMLALFELEDRDDFEVVMLGDENFDLKRIERGPTRQHNAAKANAAAKR